MNHAAIITRLLISLILMLFSKYPEVGGFTVSLSKYFKPVLTVEISDIHNRQESVQTVICISLTAV